MLFDWLLGCLLIVLMLAFLIEVTCVRACLLYVGDLVCRLRWFCRRFCGVLLWRVVGVGVA